jgi:hypothetical protein
MARVRQLQTNVTAGEFSERLDGRVDIARYANAVRRLENFYALPQGGAQRRPGLHFVAACKRADVRSRLIPFKFNDEQAYMLEWGEYTVRFYMDEGQILAGAVPYEIASPYAAAELPAVKYVQSADVMYLVHPDHPVQKLSRADHTDWSLGPVTFHPPPSIEAPESRGATLTPAATTGHAVTFTADVITFNAGDVDRQITAGAGRGIIQTYTDPQHVVVDILDPFASTAPIPAGDWQLTGSPNTTLTPDKKEPVGATVTLTAGVAVFGAEHVGQYLRLAGGLVQITELVSATVVKGEILSTLDADVEQVAGSWTLEVAAWSDAFGYPQAVTFHEDRLTFAGSANSPQTWWGSKTGDYENFAGGTKDDDATTFTISANDVNIIRWLLPSRTLLIGTFGGEFQVSGGTTAITPTNVQVKFETTYGSSLTMPLRIGAAVLFVQRSGQRLREFVFNFDSDSYVAPDLALLAEHLTRSGLEELAYRAEPDPIVFAVTGDGRLVGMTYERSQDVVGWHQHTTDGAFESVAVIPHGTRDQIWVTVRRVINGASVRYVEFLDDGNGFYGEVGGLNVDSALLYSGPAATTFSGLDHLAGKTVQIVADGAVHPPQTVPTTAPFRVILDLPASEVEIGLPYESVLETLRTELGTGMTAQAAKKRVVRVIGRFLNTLGATIGTDLIPFRLAGDRLTEAVPLFTGDQPTTKAGWDRDGRITIRQTQPLPMTVVAIILVLEVSEEAI